MSDAPATHGREAVDEVLDVVADFMEQTLIALDVGDDLEVDLQYREGMIYGDLDGDRDDIGLIIGKRGQTLDAIQYIANAVINTQCERPIPVQFDAQGYRDRRAEQLEKIADKAVSQVMQRGRAVELESMTSSERKVIHLYLKDHSDVVTASTGRDPNRRVVVEPRLD